MLQQIKARRVALGLRQQDMWLRIGISRQQYQRLETKGNPRLSTLELIAEGLSCRLMLIPKDKLTEVSQLLLPQTETNTDINNNPWQGILDDDT